MNLIEIIKSVYFWWGVLILVFLVFLIFKKKRKLSRQERERYIEVMVIKEDSQCPYCHGKFEDREIVVLCGSCKTPHHKDCWKENKGCAIFGCWQRVKI